MKKVFTSICIILCFSFFAVSEEGDNNSKSGFSYISSLGLQIAPSYANETVNENKNRFAPIKGFGIPVPFGQFVVKYSIPLDLGSSIIFSDANISFIAGPTLTPITFDNQLAVIFSPSPVMNFICGGTLGTGWNLAGNYGVARYDEERELYEPSNPFSTWKYDFIMQANFQFDFGFLFPGEWTHVLTMLSYTNKYEALTSVDNKEIWQWQGTFDNVNGWQYSLTFYLGYDLPKIIKRIGCSYTIAGHYDGNDYGDYNQAFDGNYVTKAFSLQLLIAGNKFNEFQISSSISSRRLYMDNSSNISGKIKKYKVGDEWIFNGLVMQWAHYF
ncbi:hypothetical protein [Treponema bryantii]|uniref:hypothetical protein n=1 Tax=Treponema bryantii TaxID=163 RepID=UPI002B300D8E|nr:hypothetical protein TRBR_25960 [Treponema bryantii]